MTQWPGMWRLVWPDGRRSDMVNFSRAKDAATVIAGRGVPNSRLLHWKPHEAPAEAGDSDFDGDLVLEGAGGHGKP